MHVWAGAIDSIVQLLKNVLSEYIQFFIDQIKTKAN